MSADKVYEKLFDAPVDETALVGDIKKILSALLKEQKNIDLPAETMRLRDMYTQSQFASKALFYAQCTLTSIRCFPMMSLLNKESYVYIKASH